MHPLPYTHRIRIHTVVRRVIHKEQVAAPVGPFAFAGAAKVFERLANQFADGQVLVLELLQQRTLLLLQLRR